MSVPLMQTHGGRPDGGGVEGVGGLQLTLFKG